MTAGIGTIERSLNNMCAPGYIDKKWDTHPDVDCSYRKMSFGALPPYLVSAGVVCVCDRLPVLSDDAVGSFQGRIQRW